LRYLYPLCRELTIGERGGDTEEEPPGGFGAEASSKWVARYSKRHMALAYIGMGANLRSSAGDPAETLAVAAERLGAYGRIQAWSSLYRTAPVGFLDQPHFVNAVIGIEADLGPRLLLHRLLEIEAEFGRDRFQSIPNGPRTLDLDLLIVGDLVLHEAGLDLPHPRMAQRAFVLIPLREIAPGLVEPRSRTTVAALLDSLDAEEPGVLSSVALLRGRDWFAAR
jgi:2-amino-4-hydroxy-6-hydroxymethyldihydropteridine diphosphokinase